MKNWMAIGNLFDDTFLAAINATPDDRATIVATARQAALDLCEGEEERRQVECRAIEAHLTAAGALGKNRREVEQIIEAIQKSELFDQQRREFVVSMGEAMLKRMKPE